MDYSKLKQKFLDSVPSALRHATLRLHDYQVHRTTYRTGVFLPVPDLYSTGGMVTVYLDGGIGYACQPDISPADIPRLLQEAEEMARLAAAHSIVDLSRYSFPKQRGNYRSDATESFHADHAVHCRELLRELGSNVPNDPEIVDWSMGFVARRDHRVLIGTNGLDTEQLVETTWPVLEVTAHEGTETVTRSIDSRCIRQGGLELVHEHLTEQHLTSIIQEAKQLLKAPRCPNETLPVLLDPGQMILQIHESIGHPLELDRILGDERNYAGTSFVTPEMFGSYQYGSSHLNVTFDPTVPGEAASCGFDDDGNEAKKAYLIKDGLLLNPIGSSLSAYRSGLPGFGGVACARATEWNRPTIDRMVNINLEPGAHSLDAMIGSIERGVFMKTNKSWSIDDARNKFQFGCEWGQMIEDGKLTYPVKNPSYRGTSAEFWRNLTMVGDAETRQVLGTPYCGKGEPNQVITVGHASPACVFEQVAVFGGN